MTKKVIRCYLCPLKDVCTKNKILLLAPNGEKFFCQIEWLPEEALDYCPLYKLIKG